MDSKSKNGRSPLHTTALHGHLDCMKIMLNSVPQPKFYLDIRDTSGTSPIMDAVRGGHIQMVYYLTSLDQDLLNTQDVLGRNCLRIAAHNGQHEIVRELVERYHMDVNDLTSPTTSLHWAAKEGQTKVVETLLELGANPHATDISGRIPLALSIGGQHAECSKILVYHDSLAPFDIKLLQLAKSEPMKKCLEDIFSDKMNIKLFLPRN